MQYLGVAAATAALGTIVGVLWRRPSVSLVGGLVGGFAIGIFHALQPTLFLAENGPLLAVPIFAGPATLVGLCVGLVGHRLARRRTGLVSAGRPRHERSS